MEKARLTRISLYSVIADIGFTGSGCAIAAAPASMMTEKLKGKTEDEAGEIFSHFLDLLTGRYEPL